MMTTHQSRDIDAKTDEPDPQSNSSPDASTSLTRPGTQKQPKESTVPESSKGASPRTGAVLHTKEDRKRGRINAQFFCVYARGMGIGLWVFLVILHVGAELLRVWVDFFIAQWSNAEASGMQNLDAQNWTAGDFGTLYMI